ncbi:UDP-glucose lipid carrier transferase [gamma proteobacterium HdN1]|nr:UDP-glucose lipid carrier transferase [gamma proteobacterium HdN1]
MKNQTELHPFLMSPVLRRPKRLLQNHDNILHLLQIGVNVCASTFVMFALAWYEDGEILNHYRLMAVISALLIVLIYEWRGVYRRFNGRINTAFRIARSWGMVVALTLSATFIANLNDEISRKIVVIWAGLAYAAQIAAYQVTYMVIHRISMHYRPAIRAGVLGSRWLAEHLVDSIIRNAWMPDRIVGVIDDNADALQEWHAQRQPYLGKFEDLREIITRHNLNRIYIALPISCSGLIDSVCQDISDIPVDVVWVPDIFAMRLINHSVREINGLPLISLSESPLASETQALLKGAMDKFCALLALILLSPLMVTIAALVWKSSPGPILFRQKRHGWDGRVIEVWKFRSMRMHDQSEVKQATRHDDRITPIGRFIRRTSIDELPQLFNVLQGSMSLVGPRPHAIEHNDIYTSKIRSYMLRHRTKPGMTGWAQVNGMRGETDTIEKMLRRVELDLEYINKWSIWLDIKIMIKTPFALLSPNAY